jgi:hypothetical protein
MVSSPFCIKYKRLKSGGEKKGGILQKMLILLHVNIKIAFFNIMMTSLLKTYNISLTMSHIIMDKFFFLKYLFVKEYKEH